SIPMVQWCLPCPSRTTREGPQNRSDVNSLQVTTLAHDVVDWPIHATNRFGGAAASPWPAACRRCVGDGGGFAGVDRGAAHTLRPDHRTCGRCRDAKEVAPSLCPWL